MRRRTLLSAGLSAGLSASLTARSAAVLSPLLLTGCQAPGPASLDKFGLQLSTMTSLMLADFEGTLAKVNEIGYQQIEFSAMGFLGRPVERVKELLATYNLEAPVGRVTPRLPENFFTLPREVARKQFVERAQPKYLLENVTHSLSIAVALKQRYLILPLLAPNNFQSLEQVERSIALLNQAATLCADQGVIFGYHNHNWEFSPVDGEIPFDLMLEQTNPAQFTFQLDAYWLTKAGGMLSDYLSRFAGRFATCHLKDIDEAGDFADVGDGLIDFPDFTREALAQGAQYFFVERDNPPDPTDSAQRSYSYLRKMTF